ncbi:imm11 family protein [uncultured Roseibium sp.]|uniref:imm11 family protein n=1 Tax=uncultured Roseibium sp. TaxID=1936171 RepID=UPI0032169F11
MSSNEPWLLAIDAKGLDSCGFWLEYDRKKSSLELVRLMECKVINPSDGNITFELKGRSWRELSQYHVLPFSMNTPIISGQLKMAIEEIVPDSDVFFFPVTIYHPSGASFNHWALVPLTEVPCLDLAESEITKWIVPNEIALFYKKLCFLPGCLGDKDIVRNMHLTNQILLSNNLKEVIDRYSKENVRFLRDFEIQPSFSDLRP